MMPRNDLAVLLAAWLLTACDSSTSIGDVPDLQGTWELQAFELDDGSVLPVPKPQRYTLRFAADGSVHAEVDCNLCNGTYQTDGNSITFGLLACTRALCPPGSLDQQFLAALGSASSFVRTGSELSIRYAGGTLRFRVG